MKRPALIFIALVGIAGIGTVTIARLIPALDAVELSEVELSEAELSEAELSEVELPALAAVRIPSQPPLNRWRSRGGEAGDNVRQLAESITVKILYGAAEGWGSGIIISNEAGLYTVITNQHVLRGGTSYQVQTPDGRIYPAEAIATPGFQDRDLAAVTFYSSQTYGVATLAASRVAEGDRVYATGFPVQTATASGFFFTDGQISLIAEQAFVGGYQIGYTNPVEKGMSGGPLLNQWGEVIGINGMHAYPLWGNPYVFADGTTPAPGIQEQMRLLSWAIPIENVLQLRPQLVFGEKIEPDPVPRVGYPTDPIDPPKPSQFLW